MKRYQLRQLYTLSEFNNLGTQIASDYKAVAMNPNESTNYDETISFVMSAIYGYFYEDLVAYFGETKASVRGKLYHRLGLDLSIKLPYWYKKYAKIKNLLTTEDLSLMQTSKMTSSSSDNTDSASGTLQKTATTPTGVSTGTASDSFDITINNGTDSVETTGFADKYTNAQQKFANATKVKGSRSGEVLREGSIDDLLKVLEKLPSSFADEVLKDMQKHFIFDYDGELEDLYDFTEGDFGMGIVIGKTRTNQPVEAVEGFDDATKLYLEDGGNKLEDIVDANGHKRFVEFEPTILDENLSALEPYCSCSLSGTHLMLVLAFNVANGVSIGGAYSGLVQVDLPAWVKSKIVGMAGGNYLHYEPALTGYTSGFTALTKKIKYSILKNTNGIAIAWEEGSAYTWTETGTYRIAFDLLIDNK